MPKGVYKRAIRDNKREDILKAAARVYAHYGFEGATISRMAEEANVSKSLILKYFGSKQGLVKEIASRAVQENMEKIQRIDDMGGYTLRERERRIHELLAFAREEWCLILGTLLVPQFQFQQRGVIADYVNHSHRIVMERHLGELRNPTPQGAFAYTYTICGTHIGYIFAGKDDEFWVAMNEQLDLYLQSNHGGKDSCNSAVAAVGIIATNESIPVEHNDLSVH